MAENSPVPDSADLLMALSVIEDSLLTGLALNRPGSEILAALGEGGAGQGPASHAQGGQESAPASADLAGLEARAGACTACRLASTRQHVVFGEGVAKPLVLVVGEGPGAEEDSQGLPFVGASGKLLDRMLASIGLSRRENCYIANIVKCRPPGNREPNPDEKASCMPYLREQIRLLAPRAILCAGRTAAQTLLDTTEGINRLRSRSHLYGDIPLVATYHPSALLRDETLKRPAWEDLKSLRDILAGSGGKA